MLTTNQKGRINLLKQMGFAPRNILDIGAHKGNWALGIKELFPEADVHMIEGNVNNEEKLKKTGFKYDIEVLYKEIEDKEYYEAVNGSSEGNTIYKENTAFTFKPKVVTTNTLSNIFRDDTTFQLIKIDCQGAEMDIIKGGVDLVKSAEVLILEAAILEYNEGSPNILTLLNFLDELGFRLFDIIDFHYQSLGMLVQCDLVMLRQDHPIFKHKQLQ